jgi:DNA-binding NarL/FixJ family response regulator
MPDASPSKLLNVWLIEDHQTYGERLMRALNRLDGIRCTQRFMACEDALAALPQQPLPQVLLLDVELPGMNGLDAIAPLREHAPQAAIVILTVFEDDEKIFRAICAGAAGYLLKTATTDEIADALRIAATGGSPINPRIARRVLEMFSKAHPPQRDYGLSPRERDILDLLVQGHTIKEAAAQLGIGFYTADEYIRGVYEKLQVNSRGSAIAKAVKEGLVPPRQT